MDFTKFCPILYSPQGRAIERSKMKKRLAVSAIAIAALFASTNIAVADAQSDYQLALQQYKSAVANWNSTNKIEFENFKIALQSWNAAVKAADVARKEIAAKFKIDAEAIKSKTQGDLNSAITAKDKKAASAAGKIEMDALIIARNMAIEAIAKSGPKPVKPTPAPSPTPPAKPIKIAKPSVKAK